MVDMVGYVIIWIELLIITDRSKLKSLRDIKYYQTISVLAMRLDSIYFI